MLPVCRQTFPIAFSLFSTELKSMCVPSQLAVPANSGVPKVYQRNVQSLSCLAQLLFDTLEVILQNIGIVRMTGEVTDRFYKISLFGMALFWQKAIEFFTKFIIRFLTYRVEERLFNSEFYCLRVLQISFRLGGICIVASQVDAQLN